MGLSSRLLTLRKEKKISQGDLAKKIGIHQNILGRYERDETTPNIEIVSKIADVLEVSLDYLVGKTNAEIDQKLLNTVLAIQKLPEEDRNCIMYAIDGLIQHAKTRQAYS